MKGVSKLLFFILLLSIVLGDDLPRKMNTAHIRIDARNTTISVNIRSKNCHLCPFNSFAKLNHEMTEYEEIFMEYPLEFQLERKGNTSDIQTFSFAEYGRYTLVVNGLLDPISIIVDDKGHDYYAPLYFYIFLTVGAIALIIAIQDGIKYCKKDKAIKKPLLSTVASNRVRSIDVFRGMDLCLMIFANYGAGQYWGKLIHATWDGITLSDFAFPLFIFIQGISLRLSITSTFNRFVREGSTPFKATLRCTWKCVKRAIILYFLTWLINQSTDFETIRYLGVLAYFSVSGLVNSLVLLYMPVWQENVGFISRWKARSDYRDSNQTWHVFDFLIPCLFAFAHWYLAMFVAAPGCPVGYTGPGGITEGGIYKNCTGGIYRYIDVKLLGEEHIYHGSAVTYTYGGQHFECEGFMGMMNAIFMTYLGSLISWVFLNSKKPWYAVLTYLSVGVVFLLVGGVLCGFKQFDGYMPINKNKWNTTFVFVTAGTGFVWFGIVYMMVDVMKIWTGYPYRAVGMNSILVYIVHEFVHGYIPFTYNFKETNHWTTMANSYLLGVGMWIVIANYLYRQNVFVKI